MTQGNCGPKDKHPIKLIKHDTLESANHRGIICLSLATFTDSEGSINQPLKNLPPVVADVKDG